ncbi:hypothetical protein A2X44_00845 [candidate division CPR3 bacterium GWF2_35_18]|uniref:Ferredoxin n=1 Tax=candidate division CPR3 bacterium GW2011_GWF2_35_18 TaxID=1618350 RepID=A0A0G0E4I8_UNCC3|nr:MAG: hypothetical protein UR67_C0001G0149 [candidate division CPR3 bacterium GW2011_GWF2_35_18]OGB63453.1 MAG: hypothetical protein A2X44_00845 [candidate division CPR3 bacterium GWF2_35_18]OGB64801.1 MAG: hypothetical protein A2250_05180 [candidate division CPR3 bacterium RIFOXYA2_FULL_35_13]OGB78571.1 MAG: hypothetical protein A2296_01450 [candidate division CPR3 bacterium RIFOXYB2_FULL_35_8]
MKRRAKITFDRQNCIGAAVCAAIAPKFWKMVDDGKATLVSGRNNPQIKRFELVVEVSEEDIKLLEDSARSCPVQVIEVMEVK